MFIKCTNVYRVYLKKVVMYFRIIKKQKPTREKRKNGNGKTIEIKKNRSTTET